LPAKAGGIGLVVGVLFEDIGLLVDTSFSFSVLLLWSQDCLIFSHSAPIQFELLLQVCIIILFSSGFIISLFRKFLISSSYFLTISSSLFIFYSLFIIY
jgi:hypothetical protein